MGLYIPHIYDIYTRINFSLYYKPIYKPGYNIQNNWLKVNLKISLKKIYESNIFLI